MLTIMLLAIGLPVLAGTAYLVLRNSRPQFVADVQGIALQTVIVIVVLLAIAGAVAGVLLTRGGEAVTELETTENITNPRARAGITEPECQVALGVWTTTTRAGGSYCADRP